VNEVSGAAGFILPNDRVDILLTRHPEGQQDPITDVLLQNIKVLAINQLANQKTDQPVVGHAVTIEVTQEQAQKLTLAATVGSLTLVLRNESNSTATDAHTVSVKDLRVGEANTPAAAAAPTPTPVVVERTPAPKVDPMARVEVFRGVQSSVVEVNRDAGGSTARARPSSARTAGGSSSGGS
jgi:pilus assembly protein CpaB